MHAATQALVVGPPEQIHTATRGEGGEGRVGTGEGGRHDAHGEEHHHPLAQLSRCGEHGQQFIACGGERCALLCGQQGKEHAEAEEEQIGRHEGESIGAHVLLCVAQCLAGQVFLHHILVQARHHHNDEDTAEKLFPKILPRHPVVEHEHAAALIGHDGLHGLTGREAQLAHHLQDDENEGGEHAQRLEGVGPHQRLDATAARVEPNEGHHHHHCEGEGHAIAVEHEALQDDAHHIEPCSGPCHLGEHEEGSSRGIGA